MPTPQRVIVTRPAGQAQPWLQALASQGFAVDSFPLIEIADALMPPQRRALQGRVFAAGEFDVCMWVSANAVAFFFMQNQAADQQNTAQAAPEFIADGGFQSTSALRHWATGPGTVAALQQQGIAPGQIDAPDASAAQWDAEALWRCVAPQVCSGTRVLVLRGMDVGTPPASRDWLAQQLRAAGAVVEFAAVYQRRAPQFSAAQVQWAEQAAQDGSVWVFSSAQAIAHLPQITAAQGASAWSQARCVATHPRIAQAAQAAGFAVVCTSRPTVQDVAQSIKSLA